MRRLFFALTRFCLFPALLLAQANQNNFGTSSTGLFTTVNATSGYQLNGQSLASTMLADTSTIVYNTQPNSYTGLQTFAAGTSCSSPSLNFNGNGSSTGFFEVSATAIGFCSNNVIAFEWLSSGFLEAAQGGGFVFGSSNAGSTKDTGLTRVSAGVVGVGTGASGSTAGVLEDAGTIAVGSTFSLSSNGCSAGTLTGGATAGSVASGTSGTCAFTVLMGNSATAPHGWACNAVDLTTHADTVTEQSTDATHAAFSGTTVSGDTIAFSCLGY